MEAIVSAITSLFSARILKFLFIIFLIYAFAWILSFFPFAFWFFTNVFTVPLDLIGYLYPIWPVPYIFLYWGFISLVAFIIIKLFK